MIRRFGLVFAVGVVATGCGGGGGAADATLPSSSTMTTTAVVVSSTAPSTTVATSTSATMGAVTSVVLGDEEAVALVHTRFMTELYAIDGSDGGPLLNSELVAEIATGAQLARLTQFEKDVTVDGQYVVGPGYDSNIVAIEVTGNSARVSDCSQGLSVLYDAEGNVLLAADDFFKFRSTELVKIDGRWYVENFLTGGDQRCDPADYSS